MQVYLTFDYELFFGPRSGTADRCLLQPTARLLEIASKYGIHLNFFVDSGYLLALNKYALRYPSVAFEKEKVFRQLKELSVAGHDCQLHIHPHWEDSFYDGNAWKMNTERYRLNQFSDEKIKQIAEDYYSITKEVCGKEPNAYRAGGWCLPPWRTLRDTFQKVGVCIDSTIYKNGYLKEGVIDFDFREAPSDSQWTFDTDPFTVKPGGYFTELPITSVRLSPLFFWKLYLSGRLNRSLHKAWGDGVPVPQKSTKKKVLTRFSQQALSCDGYYASILQKEFNRHYQKNEPLVVIGHPKAVTNYSIQKLEHFIASVKGKCHFARYSDLQ